MADPKTLARALMPLYGLSTAQFGCLDNIWEQESHWNVHADNPHSSAYGIPQALPGSKMSSAGPDWQNNAETQIRGAWATSRTATARPAPPGPSSRPTAGTDPGPTSTVTPDELLEAYDVAVRGSFPRRLPPGWSGERDGPLTRCLTGRAGFVMLTDTRVRPSDAELRGLVERTVSYFSGHGRWFEWKAFDHDPPALPRLLVDHGAVPEAHEALVMGEAGLLAVEPTLPADLTLRRATVRSDFERIAGLQSAVWGEDWSWLAEDLEGRAQADPPTEVLMVEDGDLVVSAAWLAPFASTRVAGLWGGSTLTAYRGRGIYRALVARRAQLAVEAGFTLLQVDASEDSRPILERLGLLVVGGTTPYVLGREH